jgi:peptidoglycan/LPS O-acetylase OafA/YrhL
MAVSAKNLPSPNLNRHHMYEIDVCRIMGALGIMLYHYTYRTTTVNGFEGPMFPIIEHVTKYGFLGVNLFFMISGFVILFSAHDKSSLLFAVSRIDRLFPVYWISVTLTFIMAHITHQGHTLFEYLMNLTMVNDYFNVRNLDSVYWSLQAELKFYVFIYLLILTRQIQRHDIWIPAWLGATICHLLWGQPFFMGWFINPSYSSYFIAGIVFCLIYRDGINFRNIALVLLSYAVSIAHCLRQVDNFLYSPSLYDKYTASIIVSLIFLAFYLISTKNILIRKSVYLVKFGAMTYPLFLLHGNIGKSLYDEFSIHINRYIALILVLFLVIGLSFSVYCFSEKKLAGSIKKLFFRLVSVA